jgi:hypothetical protein
MLRKQNLQLTCPNNIKVSFVVNKINMIFYNLSICPKSDHLEFWVCHYNWILMIEMMK